MNNPKIPRHVAVIMDGNGRWAKARGLKRSDGHRAGAKSVREIVKASRELGVEYLTLFSFSTENWRRTGDEVKSLMSLFTEYLENELKDAEMLKNGIRLRAIGDTDRLPLPIRMLMNRVLESTSRNTDLQLILALSYGGREDIVQAARKLAEEVKKGKIKPKDITVESFASSLWTGDIPEPDLLIRTGGQMRISNFLLWQLAYTELIVLEEHWPEFDRAVYQRCLDEFAHRERRFGLTSEQVQDQKASVTG